MHRKIHFGTQNNVRLQRYARLQRCRIREVSSFACLKASLLNTIILKFYSKVLFCYSEDIGFDYVQDAM